MKRMLVLASRNLKKRRELEEILADLNVEIRTLDDYPDVPDPVEDGSTFMENAEKKALSVAAATGQVSLADDSGLEVDALGGAPGIYSARFGGESDREKRDDVNNRLLLSRLEEIPLEQRTARFRCAIAVAVPSPGGITIAGRSEGVVEGCILRETHGEAGFGYDPLFFHAPSGCTFAELPPDRKNHVSHRANALAAIRPVLGRIFHHQGSAD